jgi:hypothetical protein
VHTLFDSRPRVKEPADSQADFSRVSPDLPAVNGFWGDTDRVVSTSAVLATMEVIYPLASNL